MNEKIVCEVMLYAYKALEDRCEKLDDKVLRVALGSMNRGVFESTNEILKLTDEKITYCNIKVIIDEALNKIGRNDEVKAYHIDGEYYKDIIAREEISEKTYFRRLKKQRAKLYKAITDKYDGEYLAGLIRESKWLMEQYHKIIEYETQGLNRHRSGGIIMGKVKELNIDRQNQEQEANNEAEIKPQTGERIKDKQTHSQKGKKDHKGEIK